MSPKRVRAGLTSHGRHTQPQHRQVQTWSQDGDWGDGLKTERGRLVVTAKPPVVLRGGRVTLRLGEFLQEDEAGGLTLDLGALLGASLEEDFTGKVQVKAGTKVDDLDQTIATPSVAEVQAISDKVDELLAVLRAAGFLATTVT